MTIVVSPLISLIQDQVMSLTHLGIPAGHLGADTSPAEANRLYAGAFFFFFLKKQKEYCKKKKIIKLYQYII